MHVRSEHDGHVAVAGRLNETNDTEIDSLCPNGLDKVTITPLIPKPGSVFI